MPWPPCSTQSLEAFFASSVTDRRLPPCGVPDLDLSLRMCEAVPSCRLVVDGNSTERWNLVDPNARFVPLGVTTNFSFTVRFYAAYIRADTFLQRGALTAPFPTLPTFPDSVIVVPSLYGGSALTPSDPFITARFLQHHNPDFAQAAHAAHTASMAAGIAAVVTTHAVVAVFAVYVMWARWRLPADKFTFWLMFAAAKTWDLVWWREREEKGEEVEMVWTPPVWGKEVVEEVVEEVRGQDARGDPTVYI
ncbi:hypothetical protein HDU96_004341 [Phlyctochytrium bullatum]|nr:hypothetical protein HDU96_004341 [Phlyctochytrium bullatum]